MICKNPKYITEKSCLPITVHRHPLSRFLTNPQILHKTIKNIRRKRDLKQYRRTFFFPFRTFSRTNGETGKPEKPAFSPRRAYAFPRKSIAKATVNPDEQNYPKTAYNLSLSSTLHEAILYHAQPSRLSLCRCIRKRIHASFAVEARITGT